MRFPEPIPEEHAIFYAAEIVLALNHIHSMEMIYRDLKPSNVLLNADGHIQLVDMGGVVDVRGKTLGIKPLSITSLDPESAVLFGPASAHQSLYVPQPAVSVPPTGTSGSARGNLTEGPSSLKAHSASERANSIMGTSGYMAPEVGWAGLGWDLVEFCSYHFYYDGLV